MKIFLDTADLNEIRAASETGLIDGVTTNPTLILRSGNDLYSTAKLLALEYPHFESISTEVVADTAEEMIEQAQQYIGIGPAITIKVPCTIEGLKACRALAEQGVKVNVTLIFSVSQAILAEKAGASFISPFVGRWFDNSVDGIDLIKRIRNVFTCDGRFTMCNILAASVREVYQVEECAGVGADVCTMPPKVFWKMYNNVMTDKGLEQFQKDWDSANHV
jgi:transaldolase